MKQLPVLPLLAALCCILAVAAAACLASDSQVSAGSGPAGMPDHSAASQGHDQQKNDQQKNTRSLPPDAAIAACTGKTAGAACGFSDNDVVVNGTCDTNPGVLACAPDRTGPGRLTEDPERTSRVTGTIPGTSPVIAASGVQGSSEFVLTTSAAPEGGALPSEYSCDGAGATPALAWSGAPAGTTEYALMMTTIPVDGSTRWNWVLYHIPQTAAGIGKNGAAVATTGTGSHGTVMQYDPPCPQGPGAKTYTFTLYALSAPPALPSDPEAVTGQVLTDAIRPVTLGSASVNVTYARA